MVAMSCKESDQSYLITKAESYFRVFNLPGLGSAAANRDSYLRLFALLRVTA
jgi:hypothetical protein